MSTVTRKIRTARLLIRSRKLPYGLYLLVGVLVPQMLFTLISRTDGGLYRVVRVLRFLGLGIALLLLAVASVLWAWQVAIAVAFFLALCVILGRIVSRAVSIGRMTKQAHELTLVAQATYAPAAFTPWAEAPLPSEVRAEVERAKTAGGSDELVVAELDEDGQLGIIGPMPRAEAGKRTNYGSQCISDLVVLDDYILTRKRYETQEHFAREWCYLASLQDRSHVPAIYAVDEGKRALYMSWVPGQKVARDTGRARPDGKADGAAVTQFADTLEDCLDSIHRSGITGLGAEPVLSDSEGNTLWFPSFARARLHRSTSSLAFVFCRDRDRENLNRSMGLDLLTERSARRTLKECVSGTEWYAPVDFGAGLTAGRFWETEWGTGRWEVFDRFVLSPLVVGKRILDLGSNNAVMPLMMLRAGAREVVGVERSSQHVQSAHVVRRLCEWRDMRRYKLEIRNCDMLEILSGDWGQFDLVTAFCSLYYLDAADMARVVRRASELAPVMVIQANERKKREKVGERASVAFNRELLATNGFPFVQVFMPKNLSRPLLIGKRADWNSSG